MNEENLNEEKTNEIIKLNVIYCPICSLPSEYCEYGPCYEECLPYIRQNQPNLINEEKLNNDINLLNIDENNEQNDDGEV